ncbi:MAG: OmpA family protein [Flavobacteriales bacterium]|nr:OmpA family protein [Flavobacteriales bacterium]
MTADESMLLFTRVLPDSRSVNKRQEDFFVSQKEGDDWLSAQGISEINSAMNEGAPSLSHDGQVLIFTACEIDGNWGAGRNGLGSCDLFFSQKIGREWSQPMNLGEKVNSYYWESQPSIAADGRSLYFVRGKSTAHGIKQQDIWMSTLGDDGYWQKAVKVKGEVNTPFEEESVLIHPDGQTMYFSSNGHPGMGGLDIYMSKKEKDGSWGTPVNLGYPINTHDNENSLLVSASGELAFFASDREGGFGGLDLYSFEMPEEARPNRVTYTRGEVYDALSFKKLGAVLEVIDLATGEIVCESMSNAKSGEFLVCLPVGRDYALNASREGYLFYSANFSLKDVKDLEVKELEVPMEKIKVGSKVVLNNIFFETGEYTLRRESEIELGKLVEFLQTNRHTRIEIGGHTDNVGSDTDNQKLSENRAQAVVDYLVKNGIDDYRLVAKGYGEAAPVAANDTDAGRRLNRRTEFMVVD